jgi:hypothetical protein
VTSAAATGRAHLVAPAVARSPSGPVQTAAARAPWASAWGQARHEGHTRAGVPVEAVDVVVSVMPVRCRRCQQPLPGEDAQPRRHQVSEMPPVMPVVTEYQWHQLVCPACGEETRAGLPPGGPTGEFGPRVQAITALGTGASHLSKRTTQRVLAELCGGALGVGDGREPGAGDRPSRSRAHS